MPDSDCQAPLKDPVRDPLLDPIRDWIVNPLTGEPSDPPISNVSVQPS